ncbi:hypothetical protein YASMINEVIRUS_1272 [Yasminevirus sp. GU-2018]|uniref:Uncharacterized protein n=1 Tax=Yasminevirus sp. GU-2018 TaxID=2420051 RepID=A0A5K0UAM6_9VIRU|nr:hypothetical protein YASMINEVIRUS_1272 [Yasminevirus sp. GU-2018]
MGNCCTTVDKTIEPAGVKTIRPEYPNYARVYQDPTILEITKLSLDQGSGVFTSAIVALPDTTINREKNSVFYTSVTDNPCGTDGVTLTNCNLYLDPDPAGFPQDVFLLFTLKPDTVIKSNGKIITVSGANHLVFNVFAPSTNIIIPITQPFKTQGSIKVVINSEIYEVTFTD